LGTNPRCITLEHRVYSNQKQNRGEQEVDYIHQNVKWQILLLELFCKLAYRLQLGQVEMHHLHLSGWSLGSDKGFDLIEKLYDEPAYKSSLLHYEEL
jgi:hypothetical protein